MDDPNVVVVDYSAKPAERTNRLTTALIIVCLCLSGLAFAAALNHSGVVVDNMGNTCETSVATSEAVLLIAALPGTLFALISLLIEVSTGERTTRLRHFGALFLLNLMCLASPRLWEVRLRYAPW